MHPSYLHIHDSSVQMLPSAENGCDRSLRCVVANYRPGSNTCISILIVGRTGGKTKGKTDGRTHGKTAGVECDAHAPGIGTGRSHESITCISILIVGRNGGKTDGKTDGRTHGKTAGVECDAHALGTGTGPSDEPAQSSALC